MQSFRALFIPWNMLRRARASLRQTALRVAGSRNLPVAVRGFMDLPVETIVQRGPVVFYGWALVGSSTPSEVSVLINGTRRVTADTGLLRPDVPASLMEPSVTSACGWAASVDLRREPQGDLRVQVIVGEPGPSAQIVCDRLFALRGNDLIGSIDLPLDGTVVPANLLTVRGWADAVEGVARVDVYVDGEKVGAARLGLPSPELHLQDPERFGVAAGWEIRCIPKESLLGGMHDIDVTVTDLRDHTMRLGSVKAGIERPELSASDMNLVHELQARTDRALGCIPARPAATFRNVMVFTHSLLIGGGELYLQDLLRGMMPSLTTCRLIAMCDGMLGDELEKLGVEVSINPRVVPVDFASYEGAVWELAGFLRGSGCTSVLLNTLGLWFAADAAQRAGIPTIWALHESYELDDWLDLNYGGQPASPYVRDRVKAAIRHASKLVFESDATRSMYLAAGASPGAASTVHYGVDVDAIAEYASGRDRTAERTAHDLPPGAPVLLCMGVFQERKGQLWLVDAFLELLDVHPEAILVLVGDHPSQYANWIRYLIASKNIGDRVRIVSITPDAWAWYSIADVLISASDVESLPRSMLEAMAFGCPVLAASVYGVPELITDGETGWLMAPRDTRALIAGMHRVLGLSPESRQVVGAAGRDLVRKSHRADAYVERYLAMIDEVEGQSHS